MRSQIIALTVALSSIVMACSPASAQDDPFLKGQAAQHERNYAEAAKWYGIGAEQGDPFAQTMLATFYENGVGVPENYAEAAKWYRSAAIQGYREAQYNLAVMYTRGKGVPENYVEATKWLRLAAEQEHAPAQSALGYFYTQGQGVPEDYVQAFMWLNLAAAQGDKIADENKDKLKYQMTPEQIAEAQQLSAKWKPTGHH